MASAAKPNKRRREGRERREGEEVGWRKSGGGSGEGGGGVGRFQQVEEGSDQGFQKFVFSALLPWLPLAS